MNSVSSVATDNRHKLTARHWAASLLMVISLLLATYLTPRVSWNETLGQPNYAAMLPTSFGDWVDAGVSNIVISPVETEALTDIYSQVVSRTYLYKPTGRRIMLSLAYVTSQRGSRQLHRPESCYSSQGFKIGRVTPDQLEIGARSVNIFRLSAVMASRQEQITYWIRIGDKIIGGAAYNVNLARMAMAFHGTVADGLLFRVSEISTDRQGSDQLQDQFILDILHAMTPAQQRSAIGKPITS